MIGMISYLAGCFGDPEIESWAENLRSLGQMQYPLLLRSCVYFQSRTNLPLNFPECF